MSFEKETLRDKYFAVQENELKELIDPATGLLSDAYSRVVTCPLCGGGHWNTLFVKRGYTFVRCEECGLVFTNPQVVPDLVEAAYSGRHGHEALRSTDLWMDILLNQKEVAWRAMYFADILDLIEAHAPDRGRILDVGCAVGHFLTVCRDRGWDTTGIELSSKGHKHCTETLGLHVLRQTIQEADLEPESFDAISSLGVLEHLPDPGSVMVEAVRCLRPGGVAAIVVPNMYSLLTMTLREKAVTFDGREHMIFFSMDCLRRLFDDVGLDVVHADTVLTGIPNMRNYFQFGDPYGESVGTQCIPEPVRHMFEEGEGMAALEKLILDHDLGLRLRMVGVKR